MSLNDLREICKKNENSRLVARIGKREYNLAYQYYIADEIWFMFLNRTDNEFLNGGNLLYLLESEVQNDDSWEKQNYENSPLGNLCSCGFEIVDNMKQAENVESVYEVLKVEVIDNKIVFELRDKRQKVENVIDREELIDYLQRTFIGAEFYGEKDCFKSIIKAIQNFGIDEWEIDTFVVDSAFLETIYNWVLEDIYENQKTHDFYMEKLFEKKDFGKLKEFYNLIKNLDLKIKIFTNERDLMSFLVVDEHSTQYTLDYIMRIYKDKDYKLTDEDNIRKIGNKFVYINKVNVDKIKEVLQK